MAAEGPDIDVTPEQPLYITDDNRTFGTVTISPGGQIFIQTTQQIVIQNLVKKSS